MARLDPGPVARLDPTEWAPFDQALAHIKASVGSAELGARDLHRDLRNGDLIGASRRIDYKTGEETCEIHEKTFWDQLEVWQSLGHVKVDPSPRHRSHILLTAAWVFFVHRRALDKRYPTATTTATPAPMVDPRSDDMQPPRRRPGPPPDTQRWFSICAEIARRCIDGKTGRVRIPKSEAKLAADVLKWLQENEQGEPSVSEMRAAVKHVCAALRPLQR